MLPLWSVIVFFILKTNQEIDQMKCKQDTFLPVYPLLLFSFNQGESIFKPGDCSFGNLWK